MLHQAAIPSVPRSVEDPITSNRANIDASLNLLVAARDAGVKRVVCGLVIGIRQFANDAQSRDDADGAALAICASELVAEQYCQMFTTLYGLETVTIRYFNVFGPRQDPSSPYSGVISLFIRALCEGRRPTIYGDGEQTRDFTYVANVVDGVLRGCQAKDAAGEVINVATNGRVSLNQLFASLRDLIGATVESIYADPRAGDVRDSQADISKAARLLGYKPLVTFEQGLRNTVEWYRASTESAAPARRT